jgi:putative DNA primase/helicase
MNFEAVLERFQARRVGANYMARCPAHEDKNPSLSIAEKNGKVLLHCHAGCSSEAVCAPMGMDLADLFTDSISPRIVETYLYDDEEGNALFEVVRYDPKAFRQRKPDGKGGWTWNVNGVRKVPFRLRQVLTAENIVIVEGEKDVKTAWDFDLIATCNPGGAGKWKDEYSEFLRGKNVTIIPDADEPGRKHAEQVASSLAGKAASVSICNLPETIKDLSEWPLSRESLIDLIKQAPAWKAVDEADPEGVGITMLDKTQLKDMNWLWPNRIPAGYLCVFSGNPDVGKTTIALDLVARYTTGREWPDGTPNTNPPGYVLLMIAEDGAEDVIKPRLVAAGADCSLIGIMHAKIPTGDKNEEIFVGIALRAANLCFDGKVPNDRVFFVATILRTFEIIMPVTAPPWFHGTAEQWAEVRANYAMGLTMAADCLRTVQTAKWMN